MASFTPPTPPCELHLRHYFIQCRQNVLRVSCSIATMWDSNREDNLQYPQRVEMATRLTSQGALGLIDTIIPFYVSSTLLRCAFHLRLARLLYRYSSTILSTLISLPIPIPMILFTAVHSETRKSLNIPHQSQHLSNVVI